MRIESIHNVYNIFRNWYEVTRYTEVVDPDTNQKVTEVETFTYQLQTYNKHGEMNIPHNSGTIVDIIA